MEIPIIPVVSFQWYQRCYGTACLTDLKRVCANMLCDSQHDLPATLVINNPVSGRAVTFKRFYTNTTYAGEIVEWYYTAEVSGKSVGVTIYNT